MRKTGRGRQGLGLAVLCMSLAAGFAASPQAATAAEPAAKRPAKARSWEIGEFTTVRLAPKESGAPDNEHPVVLSAEGLRAQLAAVQAVVKGRPEALFGADELQQIVRPLTEALAAAGPGEDVLLLSTSRRDAGFLGTPYGITARLFVQGQALHFIVHDVRLDFFNAYRGTKVLPTFVYGSRVAAGADTIRSGGATSRRPDWLVFPLNAPVPALAPAAPATLLPAPAAAARTAPPAVAAPAPAPAPAAAPNPGFYDAQAERLRGLKRLRDQGLISEEEYQQKRREILQTL
jgi:hypothetical protein